MKTPCGVAPPPPRSESEVSAAAVIRYQVLLIFFRHNTATLISAPCSKSRDAECGLKRAQDASRTSATGHELRSQVKVTWVGHKAIG